jgi:hypothetical protein
VTCGGTEITSGVKSIKPFAKIVLSPNPTDDNIYIDLGNTQIERGTRLEVFNALGQPVWNATLDGTERSITIPSWDWPAAPYFPKIGHEALTPFIKL